MFFYKNFWRSKEISTMTNMQVKPSVSLRHIGCMIFIIIHNEYHAQSVRYLVITLFLFLYQLTKSLLYYVSFKLTETLLREIFDRTYLLKL